MRKQTFYLLLIILLLSGCRHADRRYNHEADDVISTAIYEEIGGEDIYYQGKEVTSENVTTYEYLIVHKERGQLEGLISAVNAVLEAEDINNKISVECRVKDLTFTYTVAELTNYSDKTLREPDYDMLQRLYIGFEMGRDSNLYDEPDYYMSIPNIKYLELPERMQKKAEAENIDWYEIWPELENVEVYYAEDGFRKHYYIEKDEKAELDEADGSM